MRERSLQGSIDEAVERLVQSLRQRVRPGALDGELLEAVRHQSEGRLEQANASYRAVLSRSHEHVEARTGLAACRLQQGDDSAVSDLIRAVAEIPMIEASQKKSAAMLLAKIGLYGEALPWYREALLTREDDAELHFLLAQSLRATGNHKQALVRLNDAIRLKPDYHEAMELAGVVLIENGSLKEGRRAFRKAIEIAPGVPAYYRSWAIANKATGNDQHVTAIQNLLSESEDALGDQDQADLHYALGKAFDDLGNYDAAFQHMSAGKAAARRLLSYNEAEVHAAHRELIASFSADWLNQMSGSGYDSDAPVFIVGMPRSGSTLVEQILASHPEVRSIGERPLLHQVWTRVFGNGFEQTGYPGAARYLDAGDLREIGRRYVERAIQLSRGASRVTDKTLANFALLGMICAALPRREDNSRDASPGRYLFILFFHVILQYAVRGRLGGVGAVLHVLSRNDESLAECTPSRMDAGDPLRGSCRGPGGYRPANRGSLRSRMERKLSEVL